MHPLQPDRGGGPDFPQDAFVSKISADGSTLLYSTYLGGENQDTANGIAVDTFGNAYVTGTTLSPHFPVTTNSFDTLCGADGKCGASFNPGGFLVSNAFVTKLNPAGSGLVYSTFFGYYENVSGQAIAVDSNGDAFVTGYTTTNSPPRSLSLRPMFRPLHFRLRSRFSNDLRRRHCQCIRSHVRCDWQLPFYTPATLAEIRRMPHTELRWIACEHLYCRA